MKLCPKCGKQYPDEANFCPVDATRLGDAMAAPAAPATTTEAGAGGMFAGRFTIKEQLGGGETGAVFRALDSQTGIDVALKKIPGTVFADPSVAPRLERELKLLERVDSPAIAKVLASGRDGEGAWVATELVVGATSLASVGPRVLEPGFCVPLVSMVGDALIEAAKVGVVHRDLAPKNVLLAGDQVKLVNFAMPVRRSDKAFGVLEFVAPEQFEGKPLDQRSNLYSLGALLYLMLTGRPVTLDASGAAPLPPSAVVGPQVAAYDAAVVRALDRNPNKRYLTIRQFLDELHRISGGVIGTGGARGDIVRTMLGMPVVAAGAGAAVVPAAAAPAAPAMVQGGTPQPSAGISAAATEALPSQPAVAPVAVAAPAMAAPAMAAPAGPVLPAPAVAAVSPQSQGASDAGGKKKAAGEDGQKGGKFRETMWFKKGDLDAAAAQKAAEERARTGKEQDQDKADHLPSEDRYGDDGSITRGDRDKYSLKTGATMMMQAIDPATLKKEKVRADVSENELIGEMKGGRNKILLIIIAGVIVLGGVIALLAMR